MSIFSLMTIATKSSSLRCHRIQAACGLALALTFVVAPTRGADDAKKPNASKSPTIASETLSPANHTGRASTALRNGIRLEDEIDVVNTRSICGGGSLELMR